MNIEIFDWLYLNNLIVQQYLRCSKITHLQKIWALERIMPKKLRAGYQEQRGQKFQG
jgi:hypothetical protein